MVLTQSQGLFGRMVKWGSRSPRESPTWATHCGVIIGGRTIVEARWKVILRALWWYKGSNEKIIIFRRSGGLDGKQKHIIRAKAADYLGRTYGIGKIITHGLDALLGGVYFFRRLAFMDRYPICSWVVAFVYDKLGIRFGIPPDCAQPDDIMDYCIKTRWELIWVDSLGTSFSITKVHESIRQENQHTLVDG